MNNLFFNRELSWVEFNGRVLSQACNKRIPLLERLKFLSITESNFDDFFMIRVAGLKQLIHNGIAKKDSTGLNPTEQLEKISSRVHEIFNIQYSLLNDSLIPELATEGIEYVSAKDYSFEQQKFTEILFNEEIFPLLTPLRAKDNNSFSIIGSLKLHAAFLLQANTEETKYYTNSTHSPQPTDEKLLSILQIPNTIKRIVWLPSANPTKKTFTLIEDVILKYGDAFFPGFNVVEKMLFKPTCDADIEVNEDENNFIKAMEDVLIKRRFAMPVRLMCNNTSAEILNRLKQKLELNETDIYCFNGIIDTASLLDITLIEDFAALKFKPWENSKSIAFSSKENIWDSIKSKDIMLHVPYEDFEPIIRFINDAATDENVLAIKMTLYRTSRNSSIIQALERAAKRGKQVTVYVELKARFDEKRNISWVTRLERAGVIVVYGLVNLKVHAKLALVIRREKIGVKRYVHFSTGNYNEKTATTYSDISVFTTNYEIANDATLFFNIISGYCAVQPLKKLAISPINLKSKLLSMIERETKLSTKEKPGFIMAKMNSLASEEIIEALYKASQANVRILLNVRGICMLIPGVQNVSENIKVVSIVDRFLEHSRIFYFLNGGSEELYISSADWMKRNFDYRVELMFPVLQKDIFNKLKAELETYFADNANSFVLQSDGTWKANEPTAKSGIEAQEELYKRYAKQNEKASTKKDNKFLVSVIAGNKTK